MKKTNQKIIDENKARWETILTSIGDGVIATDHKGRISFMNSVAERLTGWTSKEALSKPIGKVFNIINQFSRKKVENPIAKVINSGLVVGLANHTVLIRKDKTEIPIDDSGAPIKDVNRDVVGVVLVFRDVSQRKKNEERIANLASFPELNPNPVTEISHEGKITYANPATNRLFPDLKKLSTKHPYLADWNSFTLKIKESKEKNITREVEVGDHWFSQTVQYIVPQNSFRIYARDVTNRKKAADALIESEKRFRTLFEALPLSTVVFQRDGKDFIVKEFNKASMLFTGGKMKDFIGKKAKDIYADRPEILRTFDLALKTKRSQTLESYYRKVSTGEEIFLKVTMAFIPPDRIILHSEDLTEQKKDHEKVEQSNKKITEILESMQDGFHALDRNFNFTYINKYAEKMLRVKPKQLLGRNIWKVYPKLLGTDYEKNVRLAMIKKEVVRFEWKGLYINKWFEYSLFPTVEGLSVYWNDITKRKMVEDALRQSEAKFKALYDSNIIGVLIEDLKGNILDANDAYLNMIGYSRKDLEEGKLKWTKLTPKEYRGFDEKAIKKLLTKGMVEPYEKENIKKDGSQIPLIVGKVLVNKDTTETIAFVLDISERKKLDQRKDEFISIASHELKTPLTSIKGYTQILERIVEELGDERAKIYLSRTNTYIDRLNSLIADLLDVSKIQAGKLMLNREKFKLNDLINDSIEAIQPTAENHKIIYTSTINKIIYGDKNRLEQVLVNLLSNAIKYSPKAKQVLITAEVKNQVVVIAVKDFGIGIAEGKQLKIFDRFYRVENLGKEFSGLGIGLYISAEIVRRHGGHIWVESKVGKGSTFSFSLPIKAI